MEEKGRNQSTFLEEENFFLKNSFFWFWDDVLCNEPNGAQIQNSRSMWLVHWLFIYASSLRNWSCMVGVEIQIHKDWWTPQDSIDWSEPKIFAPLETDKSGVLWACSELSESWTALETWRSWRIGSAWPFFFLNFKIIAQLSLCSIAMEFNVDIWKTKRLWIQSEAKVSRLSELLSLKHCWESWVAGDFQMLNQNYQSEKNFNQEQRFLLRISWGTNQKSKKLILTNHVQLFTTFGGPYWNSIEKTHKKTKNNQPKSVEHEQNNKYELFMNNNHTHVVVCKE